MKRLFKSIVVLGVLLVSKTISQVISSTTTTKTSTFAATPTPTPTPSPQTPLLRISSLSVTDENGAGVSALSGNSIASTIRQPQIANQNCSQQTSKTANPLQIGKNSSKLLLLTLI